MITKTKIFTIAVAGILYSGISFADNSDSRIGQGMGIDEFIDNLEYKIERKEPSFSGEDGGHFSDTVVKPLPASASKASQKGDPNCSTVWLNSTHRWRYEGYIPGVHVRTRMWITSKSYSGSASNPLACWERWYFSDRITNSGTVNADANCNGCARPVMARISNHSQHNQALLNSYRSAHNYGGSAVKPTCGTSNHSYVINGQTFSYTRKSGYCSF